MNKLIPIACAALLGGAGGAALAGGQQEIPGAAQDTQQLHEPQAGQAAPDAAQQGQRWRARAQERRERQATAVEGDGKIQQVTVSGNRDMDVRRTSTASKMVFGREELDRNGDSSVGEILKRLPGVQMGGAPGRGSGIRMRGLGNGYTQMLVNGERPPPGFSLESLAPEQVERIEIMRGPVAEHSTQAIAGTINIVLREGYQQKDVQVRVADNIEQGRHGPYASVTVPGKAGNLTWLMSAGVMQHRNHNESNSHDLDTGADGSVTREQDIRSAGNGKSTGVHLSPRLSFKFDNGDTLNVQPFLVHNRSSSASDTTVDQLAPDTPPPDYAREHGQSESSGTWLRGFGNWVHKMGEGAKLDVKFSGGSGRSDSSSVRHTWDGAGLPKRTFNDSDANRSHGFSTGGKYSTPLGSGHLLAAGWDAELNHLSQVHVAEDDGSPLFEDSGANLTADTRRVAGFAQDEWDITKQWSAYFGLRWEGIRTTSSGSGAAVKNTSSVWSPVLHTVWRIPGHDKDQLRASVTQSYRAPSLNDLIAAPTFSTNNQATRPDRIGNPNLKPELAKGLDLAYEHYLGRSGIVSASAFARNIDNLMRRTTTKHDTALGPHWVSTPSNIGHAHTSGIELEAKFSLAELYPAAPNVDFRSNYSRYWSRVDGIPGPDNRLDQQAKQTANVGADWRIKAVPLTLGGSLNWTPATVIQTSLEERDSTGVKRQVDVYGLWKFSLATQLRLSANNASPQDYLTGRTVATGPLSQATATATATRTYTTFGVRLETKI